MKKNVIKSTIRNTIDGILIFLLFITTTVYALPSNGVLYDNTNSGSSAATVNEALDDLYTKVNDKQTEINRINGIGDAAASHILNGKTAYVKGQTITGTMPSKGAATYTPSTSNQTIASGNYLSGAQTIKGDANLVAGNIAKGKTIFGVAGLYTSDANAAAGNILSGKTAYVNGAKVTGTMNNYSNNALWINTDNGSFSVGSYTYSSGETTNEMVIFKSKHSGYFDTNTKFLFDKRSDIAPSIKAGTNFFGVTGTFTNDANAAAANILKDKTAYVKGNKVTGTIPSKGAATYTPSTSNQTIAAGNYLSGAQTIKGDANLVAGNIKKGVSIFGVSGTYIPTGTNAGIHINETTNYCGVDWTLKAAVSAGTYIVTNIMYSPNGTGSASTMNMSPLDSSNGGGVTVKNLSSSKSSYNVVETYLVTLTSNKAAGTAMGRMSNCSQNPYTATLHGKSAWVKIA